MERKAVSGIIQTMLFIGILTFSVQETFTQSKTTFYVNPLTTHVLVNMDFSVNVIVADVADLVGFQFYLSYNTTLLDALTVIIKPPFEGFTRINETEGYAYAGGVLPTDYPPLYGSVSLASITFNALASGSCTLHLYNTILFDSASDPIVHTAVDGSVIVSSKIIVPDGYPTIQEAINHANPGDTVYVRAGTYYEGIVVNKTLSLIGENRSTTIIDGNTTFVTVVLLTVNNVSIRGFTIQNNQPIMCLVGGGIYITDSNGTNIIDNVIKNNQKGINLENSAGNTILGNTIIENDVGIQFLDNSYNNTIYHNNFINNKQQVVFYQSFNNTWNDDYPSGGNSWTNHNPQDIYNGPYQNETGRDRIGDTPYVIDANNKDKYPLTYPYGYVPNPDINKDGTIDKSDLDMEAESFGSIPGDPNWNPITDLNQDGITDIFDLVMVAIDFGKTYP